MPRENYNDLAAFIAVARERSFTRAAALLGVSQSALSHTIRALETRLGVRLLTRTTRSVSPTEAGDRLLATVAPRFEDIEAELASLSELRDRPVGNLRITTSDHAARWILWPKLKPLLREYPEIKVEIVIDYGLTDIVAERYDMGVRLGDELANDMIAVRISPDIRFMVVGTPDYFSQHAAPETPNDLTAHRCINIRLPTYGGLYAWELQNGDHEVRVRVDGQLVFNNIFQVLDATLDGFGLAYMPEDLAQPHLDSGALVQVLPEWSPPYSGFHLYYPSRRQSSRAMSLVIDALRYRE